MIYQPGEKRLLNRRIQRKKVTLSVYPLFLIAVATIAVGFSVAFSIFDYVKIRSLAREVARTQNVLNRRIQAKTDELKSMIMKNREYLGPNGLLNNMITAYNFLSNEKLDFEKMIKMFSGPQTGAEYFTFFITGSKRVWIGIKSPSTAQDYSFQKDLLPGLCPYDFYTKKGPSVDTSYSIKLKGKDYKIFSASPDNTYVISKTGDGFKIYKLKK